MAAPILNLIIFMESDATGFLINLSSESKTQKCSVFLAKKKKKNHQDSHKWPLPSLKYYFTLKEAFVGGFFTLSHVCFFHVFENST